MSNIGKVIDGVYISGRISKSLHELDLESSNILPKDDTLFYMWTRTFLKTGIIFSKRDKNLEGHVIMKDFFKA